MSRHSYIITTSAHFVSIERTSSLFSGRGRTPEILPPNKFRSPGWKAYLHPAPAGGSYTITARCTAGCTGNASRDVASIERVTAGDVYFCGGQSNMALPLTHTFSEKS